MGTSGSGKSTVGSALSSALSCRFIDGDDLHPASNVLKMSKGQPLNDDDREPWLLKIRQTGLKLATTQTLTSSLTGGEVEGLKELAQVYETCHQETTLLDIISQTSSTEVEQPKISKQHIAIIACSSLKLIYRKLLRGTIKSLNDPNATQPETELPQDLKVIHIYLDLTKELLEERMENRKGHFMKLEMLYSQLDTLQKPVQGKEPGVVVVKVERDTTTDQIVSQAIAKLRSQNVV